MSHSLENKKRLEKKADEALRDYLRWRDTDGVYFVCFCCQKKMLKEYASVGHFRKRGNHSTRWLLKNNHLICISCQDEGNPKNEAVYAQRLDLRYGECTAEWLEQLSNVRTSYFIHELIDIIDSFQKLKEAGIR